ncbi:hypothetical protein F383_28575 [Gossypium arboreum]|uniref:Uncharacterized protein n=1 Tax=Gossypium arboreum TaxID=29729 RepID=A0A0B0MUZ5_GOSAR|nr:hypothetical protein F383_28575 [Gossypium arboreum]
MFHTVSHRGL